jgi:hypothetical protein
MQRSGVTSLAKSPSPGQNLNVARNDASASKVLLSRYGVFFMRSPRNSVTTYVGLGSGARVPTKGGVLENPNLGTCDALVSV